MTSRRFASKKYRIVEIDDAYYIQKRNPFIGWRYMQEVNEGGGYQPICYDNIESARGFIRRLLQESDHKPKIHGYFNE